MVRAADCEEVLREVRDLLDLGELESAVDLIDAYFRHRRRSRSPEMPVTGWFDEEEAHGD